MKAKRWLALKPSLYLATKNNPLLVASVIVLLAAGTCPLMGAVARTGRQGRQTARGTIPKPGDQDDSDSSHSEMRPLIERYMVDRGALNRTHPGSLSPARHDRFSQFYTAWLDSLKKLSFDTMGIDGRADYLLFKNHLEYELRQIDIQARQLAEIEPLIPFSKTIVELDESRRRMQPIDSAKVAATLTRLREQ